jgi:predicted lipid-binding transport protein (Tim44 family)
MGEGFQALDIILFAMIAAFLVLRLGSVLGKKTGHQRPPPEASSRREEEPQSNDNVIELPSKKNADAAADVDEGTVEAINDPIAAGLAQIKIADSSFNAEEFVSGAQSAFEHIVQNFADGNKKGLRALLNDEVYDNFTTAIDEREGAGETLETTVIGIKRADIVEARLEGRTVFVTIKFVSEQVKVTRNDQEEIVDGDASLVSDVTDIWTFARNTRARDPNWTLIETRSQN